MGQYVFESTCRNKFSPKNVYVINLAASATIKKQNFIMKETSIQESAVLRDRSFNTVGSRSDMV